MTSERSPALVRSRDRVLGGVCAGVAERVGVDPLLVRLLTVMLALISAGAVVLVYVVLWAVLPEAAPQPPALAAGPPPLGAETAPQPPVLAAGPPPVRAETTEALPAAEPTTQALAAETAAVAPPTAGTATTEVPVANPRGAWNAVGGELRALAGELRRSHPAGATGDTMATDAATAAEATGSDPRPAPLKAADRAMSTLGEHLRAPEVRSSARQVAARLSDAVRISADDLRHRSRRG